MPDRLHVPEHASSRNPPSASIFGRREHRGVESFDPRRRALCEADSHRGRSEAEDPDESFGELGPILQHNRTYLSRRSGRDHVDSPRHGSATWGVSWARWGSNPRPRDYESHALTAELQALGAASSSEESPTLSGRPARPRRLSGIAPGRVIENISSRELGHAGLRGRAPVPSTAEPDRIMPA